MRRHTMPPRAAICQADNSSRSGPTSGTCMTLRLHRAIVLAVALGWAGALVAGPDPESDTDGFDPAAESFRINEARRLNEISRQLELNFRMLWLHGYDPSHPPIRQPSGYESKQLGPNRWIYRPLYDDEGAPIVESPTAPELLPTPATESPPSIGPELPAPADAQRSKPAPVRKPAPRRGREF